MRHTNKQTNKHTHIHIYIIYIYIYICIYIYIYKQSNPGLWPCGFKQDIRGRVQSREMPTNLWIRPDLCHSANYYPTSIDKQFGIRTKAWGDENGPDLNLLPGVVDYYYYCFRLSKLFHFTHIRKSFVIISKFTKQSYRYESEATMRNAGRHVTRIHKN